MQGKKSRRCRTCQNRIDVRIAKAKRSLAYAISEGNGQESYFRSLIVRLEAMIGGGA